MIKKIIEKIKDSITSTISTDKVDPSELEAPVFECKSGEFSHGFSPYTGVPAPVVTSSDEWFGEPTLSKKGWDIVQQESKIKEEEFQRTEELRSSGVAVEDENIHQKMYEISTKNWTTVDESTFTLGGSENFQEGPGSWHSGTGYSQFR